MASERNAAAVLTSGGDWRHRACQLVLGLLLCAAPLAYGCVDREWQLALAAVFAVCALAVPIQVPALPRWALVCAVACFALLAVKDFSPAAWMGIPR